MGRLGPAMLLVSTIAGLAIFTPLMLIYAARCYYVVLTMSSTGEERFRWPKDTFLEWVGQAVPILGLLFFWATFGLMCVGPLLLLDLGAIFVAAAFLLLYLAVPVTLCSMLSAPSKLLLFYPPLIGRLLRHGNGLAYVYVINLPSFTAVLVSLYCLLRNEGWAMPLFSVLLPPTLLLHARGWGRLVWLAMNYDLPKPKRKKRRKAAAVAPEATAEPVAETAVRATAGAGRQEAEDEAAYGVESENEGPSAEAKVDLVAYYEKQREYEKELRKRAGDPNPDPLREVEPPTLGRALGKGIFSYLLYEETLTACLAMCAVTLGWSGLMLMLVQLLGRLV
jgi:hypothetical protein